ncbi:MAG: VanZ family protein [Parcubacteria group bacterium]|jgi:VanZ family protein
MFKKFIKYYLPALLWMGIIFYFSSIPGLRYSKSAVEEIILRKGAHFAEFSILFFLLWRIFFLAHKLKIQKAYWLALLGAIFFGASDELHQTLVMGRTGKIIDAIFDSGSIIFSAEIFLILINRKIKWKNIFVLFFSTLMLLGLGIKMIQDGKSSEKKAVSVILENEAKKVKEDLENRIGTSEKEIILNNEKMQDDAIVTPEKMIEKVPDKILIEVPFTSQAPFSKWDEIHKETCEEASIVMLEYYFTGKKLTREIAEKEIQALVKFQNKNYGDFKDTTAQQTIDLFLDFYGELPEGKKLKVVYDFEKEDLKKYLAQGFPIIIPAAGRELGNPNFTAPGPLYHNLVLTGYDGDTIITNDPGTRKGEGYKYNMDVLYSAIHDFPRKPENIKQGRKAMIVVE